MPDEESLEAQLRATSDVFMARLEEIRTLEEAKRELAPAGDEFVRLADLVERAVRLLHEHSVAQDILGREAHEADIAASIQETPASLTPSQLLSRWRDFERQLEGVEPESSEAEDLRFQISTYRLAYQDAYAKLAEPLDD